MADAKPKLTEQQKIKKIDNLQERERKQKRMLKEFNKLVKADIEAIARNKEKKRRVVFR